MAPRDARDATACRTDFSSGYYSEPALTTRKVFARTSGPRGREPAGPAPRGANFGDEPMTKKAFMLAAAFVVATGLLGFKMLIAPPVTLAAQSQGLDIHHLARSTPRDLPSFESEYQRHLGVLDVLNAP